MSNTPGFASVPTVGAKVLTAANGGSRSAPTNVQTIFQPSGSSGGLVERITVIPTATTIAGTVQIYRYDGTNYWFYCEIQLQVVTVAAGTALLSQTIEAVDDPNLFPIVIPPTWTLVASLSIAQSGVCVQAEGGVSDMQRGMIGFPFPTGRNLVQQVVAPSGQPSALGTTQGNGAMKASIVLFDTRAGTRSWVCPAGVTQIRAFVVGGAGGSTTGSSTSLAGSGGGYSEIILPVIAGTAYSYTVGAAGVFGGGSPTPGGTSSFAALISATGGAATGGTPGVGSGGSINTSGGTGGIGGGASGHRFGNGQNGSSLPNISGGGGWVQAGSNAGGDGGVDGFGLGLIPGKGGATYVGNSGTPISPGGNGDYGAGGGSGGFSIPVSAGNGGIGGGGGGNPGSGSGGGAAGNGGIGAGGGGSFNNPGLAGPGLVGIEVLG